jgi:hypothetical protein
MMHACGGAWRSCAAAFALVVFLAAGPALAAPDWNRTDDPLYEAIGLHAGKIGGVGLSLKFPFKWWLYGQATGGVWHTADNKRHNFGFMGQYILRQDANVRVFVAAGFGYFYHKKRVEVMDGPDRFQINDSWNKGFGVGVEMLRSERIAVQIEGDFTHEGDDGTIMFFPQVGLYYYF